MSIKKTNFIPFLKAKTYLKEELDDKLEDCVNPPIADNLNTNDATQVLSAKQGKVLNDLIGSAISYINQ